MKERPKLTKSFYKSGQKREDKEKLESKAAYCTDQIMKGKNDYTQRMTNKLDDSKATPKTNLSVLKRFHSWKPPPPPPFRYLLKGG